MKSLIGVSAAVVLLLTAATRAQDQVFTPDRIGIRLGTDLDTVVDTMQRQGFVFRTQDTLDDPATVPIVGVGDSMLVDTIIIVAPEMGSVNRWNASRVILGFKEGRMAAVIESEEFDAGDAEPAYAEIRSALNEHYQSNTTDSLGVPVDEYGFLLGRPPYVLTQSENWLRRGVVSHVGLRRLYTGEGELMAGRMSLHVIHLDVCAYDFLRRNVGSDCE